MAYYLELVKETNQLKVLPETIAFEALKILHKKDYVIDNAINEIRKSSAKILGSFEWAESEIETLESAIRSHDPRSLHQIAKQVSLVRSPVY